MEKVTKRVIFIGMSLLLLAAIIILGIQHFDTNYQEKIVQGSNEDQKEHTSSKYPGVGIVTSTQDIDGILIHEKYPEFSHDHLDRSMKKLVKNHRKDFSEEVGKIKDLKKSKIKPYYHMYFDITPLGEHIYSIVMHTEKNYATANAEIHSQPFLVDVQNDRILQMKNLFSEEDYTELTTFVLKELKKDPEKGQYIFDEAYKDFLNQHHLAERLVLNSDGAEFLFEPYSVGARAAGTPSVKLSLEELALYFTDEAVKRLGVLANNDLLQKGKKAVLARQAPELPENMPKVVTNNPKAGKKVALTFDDGPHPENTPAIMQLLKEHQAKATFFMLGSTADFYPELIQQVVEAGHEVGSHSWNHPQLSLLDEASIKNEVDLTDNVFKEAIGYAPNTLRPPYGDYDDRVSQLIDKPLVLWSIDTLDWKSRDPQAILAQVQSQLHDGAIILMHDIHDETVSGTALVLDYLDEQGYECVTVSELFE